jgi:hypothetical protein
MAAAIRKTLNSSNCQPAWLRPRDEMWRGDFRQRVGKILSPQTIGLTEQFASVALDFSPIHEQRASVKLTMDLP